MNQKLTLETGKGVCAILNFQCRNYPHESELHSYCNLRRLIKKTQADKLSKSIKSM